VSVSWPPLDTHAHVDVNIGARELLELRAVVFAASRSLAESSTALSRQAADLLVVWGLGVHPGLKDSLEDYDHARFSDLLDRTAYVGEVGLDGKAKGRLPRQQQVLSEILATLQERPRITSLHSYAATHELLESLDSTPIEGAVLHWWLGDAANTRKAVEAGAYFSVNMASLRHEETISEIPLERILLETDHPDGNRSSPAPRRPGRVDNLEKALGSRFGLTPGQMRLATWRNLRDLVDRTRCADLLPQQVGSILSAVHD
jgi:TatD DNase family protein